MIRVDQLAAGYGSQNLFSRLSFYAGPDNSPLVLVGRNGSGKSTLLRILAGFLPAGQGRVDNSFQKGEMAWLPQNYRVNLDIPVKDFVMMACEKPGFWSVNRPPDAAERSLAALSNLGILHLAGRNCTELSGGEWQLTCLAQMLVQQAGLWLLDEPTASLDIGYKKAVFDLLWKEAASGKTIVFSTHDLPFLPAEKGSLLLIAENPELYPNNPAARQEIIDRLMHR